MSEETDNLGNCPDCGQEYKDPHEILPPPSDIVVKEPMTTAEWAAELHQDIECPVQRERDYIASMEAAMRYFGAAEFVKLAGDLIRENEHDAEIILGDAERRIKREQERGNQQPPRRLTLVGEGGGDNLDVLNLSSRARRALCANNSTTVGQLTQKTEWQLLGIKDFGKKALNEVRAALKARGLSTADDSSSVPS